MGPTCSPRGGEPRRWARMPAARLAGGRPSWRCGAVRSTRALPRAGQTRRPSSPAASRHPINILPSTSPQSLHRIADDAVQMLANSPINMRLTLTANSTLRIDLRWTNVTNGAAIERTLLDALPRAQDRLCLAVDNRIPLGAPEAAGLQVCRGWECWCGQGRAAGLWVVEERAGGWGV